jgi:phosphopantetheinyl transferase
VSISHSGQWGAALAFPERHPLAIDIEEVNPDRAEAIRSQLTAAECRLLKMDAPDLIVAWTIKEALAKVIRCGMMTPFSVFEIATIQHEENRMVATFTNFAQYKANSFFCSGMAITLVTPKNTTFQLQIWKDPHA